MKNHEELAGIRRLQRTGLLWALGSLALVGLLLASSGGKQASMPGPLSKNHAHLREDCAACHSSALDSIQSLWHGLGTTRLDLEQSEHCLNCHDLGPSPRQPHGWTETELGDALASVRAPAGAAAQPGFPSAEEELACNACHREHRGRLVSLQHMTDERCQACHQETWEAFGEDHPEFKSFPYTRRTNLIFDHTLHILREFRGDREDDAPRSCSDCHRLDPTGRHMPVLAYEATCAACHDDEIRGASQLEGMGLSILALPAIDMLSLEDNGIGIGQWPADSSLTEMPLTPFLALLLSADEQTRSDIQRLRNEDLLDLEDADLETLEAVGRVVWAIKVILLEISRVGHRAILTRIELAIGGEEDLAAAEDLLAGLPEDLVTRALAAWIPDLADEVKRHEAGTEVPTHLDEDATDADLDADKQREAWVYQGGWYVEQMNFALRYRPTGHADPLLKAWLDLSARGADVSHDLFGRLADPTSVGTCTKCHSVEQVDGDLVVHWKGAMGNATRSTLTKYSHVEHFAAVSENACIACHELDRENEGWEATYADSDASQFLPGFQPMSIATCAECHRNQGAPSSCVTCHDYHAHLDTGSQPGAALNVFFQSERK